MTLRRTATAMLGALTISVVLPAAAGAQTATAPVTPAPLGGPAPATSAPAPAQAAPEAPPAGTSAATPAPAQTAQGRALDKRVEARIRELRTRLKITQAEQPQWDSFAQTMRDNAAHMDQVFADRGDPSRMNALDDMRAYASVTQAHAEDMQRLLPAFQQLYDSLSPQQKHLADTAFHEAQQRDVQRATRG